MSHSNLLPEEHKQLTTLVKKLIKRAGGADYFETRVARTHLHNYGDSNHLDLNAPIDIIADLEKEAGEPIVTTLLAQRLGYILVPVNMNDTTREPYEILSDVGSEAGELISKLGKNLKDNNVSRVEALETLPKIYSMFAALSVAANTMKEIASGKGTS